MNSLLCAVITLLFAAKPEPVASFVHPDAPGKLPIIGSVAVVLSGIDRPTTRLLEDALTINVLAESIRVVYPGEKEIGTERSAPLKPPEFARKIGANCLLTGNVIARCQVCSRGQHPCTSEGIRAVSLSLVDLAEDKVLVWALYEPDSGTGAGAIAQEFVRFMIESLKMPEQKQKEQK
ncbi:MAG: hypothetical protein ACP5JB_05255 [candidate division WOR-3 bacterium]|jgi:hypothetical protein